MSVGPALRRWLVAVCTMTATILVILDVTIANVALDHMRGSLSAGVDEITWVLTSFLVANAISLPISGWLIDLLGRRRLYLLAVTTFTLASAAAGAAPSLTAIVVARFVQGLAGGPLVPLSQSTMLEAFPRERHGMAMAVWGVGIMFAPIVGPVLGGWITDHWSWRWVFYINVPVGAAALVLAQAVLPEPVATRGRVQRIDLPGLALLVVGVGGLQFVLDRGQREDWFASPLITRVTAVALVALALLVAHELRARDPVVDLRVLRHRTFAVATLVMLVVGVAFYAIIVLAALFTQMLLGYTALLAGLALAPGGVATLMVMPVVGALANRLDPRWVIGAGCLLSAIAMALMAGLTLEATFWQVALPRFIQGFGIGLIFVPLATLALGAVPPREVGHASGLFNFIRTVGGSLGIAVMATLLERGAQGHRARLVEHVSLYEPEVWHRLQALAATFAAQGADPVTAEQRAWALLDATVQRQALLLAFLDDFRYLALVFLGVLPLLLGLGRARPPTPAPARVPAAAPLEG